MKEVELSPAITIGPQLHHSDVWEDLSHRGFRTVVNLSQKGELGQRKPYEEEVLVNAHGMDYLHFPVSVGAMKIQDVDDLMGELRGRDMPLYLHCRLGQRSGPIGLLLHAMRQRLSLREVMERARGHGLVWTAPFLNEFIPKYFEQKTALAV